MPTPQPIQLDAAFAYQKASIEALRLSLSHTHGDVFAVHFLCEHDQEVLRAIKTRLCGRSEKWLKTETMRLTNDRGGMEA
jgi:hypothetical protein